MEVSSAAKVGIITILAVVVFALILGQLGHWQEKQGGFNFSVVFDNIGGLVVGASVMLSGVEIGKVKEIEIFESESDGKKYQKIKVTAVITKPGINIYKNSSFGISGSMWGEKWLEIGVGNITDSRKISENEVVTGEDPISFDQLTREARETMVKLDALAENIDKIFGDPKVMASLKDSLENISTITKEMKGVGNRINDRIDFVANRINDLVCQLQRDTQVMASDLKQFSGSLKRIAGDNEGDLKILVKNLKNISQNLDLSMESIKELTTNESFNDNILVTLENIRKTSEDIRKIATDVNSVTGDPQVKSDVRDIIKESKGTFEGANELIKKINSIFGEGDTSLYPERLFSVALESEWRSFTGRNAINLNGDILPYAPAGLRLGVDDAGYDNLFNIQYTRKMGNLRPRIGIIRSKPGIGVDSNISKIFSVGIDAYDLQDSKVDVEGRVKVGKNLYFMGGVRNIFNPDRHQTIFGIGAEF